MDTNNMNKTTKITLDITKRAAELIAQEGKENKRSRKAQMELNIERHADRYAKKAEGTDE